VTWHTLKTRGPLLSKIHPVSRYTLNGTSYMPARSVATFKTRTTSEHNYLQTSYIDFHPNRTILVESMNIN